MCSAFPTVATTLGASRLRSYTLCRTTRIVSMVWAASAAGQTARSVGARRITRFREEAMPGIYWVAILLSMRKGATIGADLDLGALRGARDDRMHKHTRTIPGGERGREVPLRLRVIKLMVSRHGLEAFGRLIAAQRSAKRGQVRRVAGDQQLGDSLSVGLRTGREYATQVRLDDPVSAQDARTRRMGNRGHG